VLPDGNGVHLIMAASAPGVFGGDRLTQTVIVESGARVKLTSQSATQVHANGAGAPATLTSTYRVESDGRLDCEWDPVIPFPDARLDQRIVIDLADSATLLWSDALMAGREARGERWQFSRLSHELRLLRAGTLEYMERYRIVPSDRVPNQRWAAADACYFGTLLALGASMDRALASHVHDSINAGTAVRASADLLDDDLLLVRLASSLGLPFHESRAFVARAIRAVTHG
jgi:urease accessory protein